MVSFSWSDLDPSNWDDDISAFAEKAWDKVYNWGQDAVNLMTFGLYGKLDDYAKEYLRDPLTGRKVQEAMMAQQKAQMELQAQQMAQQRSAARRAEERIAAANRRAPDIGMQLANAMSMGVAGGNRGTMLFGTKPPMDFLMGGPRATILGG
jgi:hypothetical protein